MELNLTGKVALVASSSRGLGYAIAYQLAAEGAAVSICARGHDVHDASQRITAETGSRVIGTVADMSDNESISRWVDASAEALGGVDCLCVNAGGPTPGTFAELDDEAWRSAYDLLLLSSVRQVRCALPYLKQSTDGSIVFLTSSAVKEPISNLTLSNVVRASVAALSKSLANELATDGIRVNHLVPGRIRTERVERMDELNATKAGVTIQSQRERSWSSIPLRRYGEPQEFAHAAAFLLSGAASYITGATLQVDGGLIRGVF